MLASKPTSINHLWTSWSETCGLIWSDGLHIFCHNGKWMEINMIVSLGCWLEARCKRCSVEVTLWHPDSIYSTQSMQTVMDRIPDEGQTNCVELLWDVLCIWASHQLNNLIWSYVSTLQFDTAMDHCNVLESLLNGTMYIHIQCDLSNITTVLGALIFSKESTLAASSWQKPRRQ